MCGLVGIFDPRGPRPIDPALLERMNFALRHRGPDGDGFHLAPGIGLGHRRLAIIDLAGGRQPLFNEDGSVAVLCNGEIYNFQSLMAELVAKGHRFRTRSDCEVIAHAWEEWGEACLDRLRGMFAIALWDARQQTLLLARDRLGKKPLYWSQLPDGQVIFGSELKALLAHPQVVRDLDPRAVEDYFAYGYVPDPKTIYRGVAKLPAAHRLVWRSGDAAPRLGPYWDMRYAPAASGDMDTAAEALIERLREAVRLRLISDVPLGAFLSGGIDSSAIVALMAELSGEPVATFSIGFDVADVDESRHAELVAQRFATRHYSRIVSADMFDEIDRLATIYDEPFGDPSALPTLRVAELARERVTVALSGDGGDELLGGYRRYGFQLTEERLRRMLPASLRRPVFGALARAYPKLDWAPRPLRAKQTFMELAHDTVEGYFDNVSVLHDGIRARLFSHDLHRRLDGYRALEALTEHARAADTDDPLALVQYIDLKTYLSGGILTKVDRASMAASLEVRAPLLDHEFAAWTQHLPTALKRIGTDGKRVLKAAFADRLPASILERPKQGFVLPIAAWFRGPLADHVRLIATGTRLAETGLFNRGYLNGLVEQHQSGRWDHSRALWSLTMFDAFLRRVHDVPASVEDARPERALRDAAAAVSA
ncbi:MAG: amidotransferase 1, exosortase A system-associated [Alphaproteobacteria bacterium]|nr:amidotransferase 1, exosortase A system-associated [Alphaproteobacteria bacterium]